MSLLFHLYDSDNEDDDEEDGGEARPDTVQMALIRYLLANNVLLNSAAALSYLAERHFSKIIL